jgi:tetratricopeptide (TPR) repeat protein
MKTPTHKWTFRQRFRTNAFGWKASRLASQRLKEALTEIKAVARVDPLIAAEGAIVLMEKIWPALAHVDSSSGALGNAVNKTVQELVDIVVAAPADEKLRERWLERMWTAVEDDGVDYLWEVSERWGELCGSPERASRAADEFLPLVRLSWRERGGYFRGTPACLGCLLVAERLDELLALIDTAPYLSWSYRRFGVRALAAMGRTDEAIEYAQSSLGLNDSPAAIDRACEEILLEAGRSDEAYDRFALEANRAGTHLATCRALIKKYPDKEPRAILDDLIASTPDDESRWFATAKTLGFLDLAAELAERSPVDISTLLRAARDFQESNPSFALQAALAALRWMAAGRFYELRAGDIWDARRYALETAEATGQSETVQVFLDQLTANADTDPFVRQQLEAPYGARHPASRP